MKETIIVIYCLIRKQGSFVKCIKLTSEYLFQYLHKYLHKGGKIATFHKEPIYSLCLD